jgi:hypothetical protein
MNTCLRVGAVPAPTGIETPYEPGVPFAYWISPQVLKDSPDVVVVPILLVARIL